MRRVPYAIVVALCVCASSFVLGTATAAARTIELTESGNLHLAGGGSETTTLFEQGQASGTFDCPVTVHLDISSPTHVTGTFTVHPHGGTISGGGTARLEIEGPFGYFGGTLMITHGTGSYAHASGSGIGFSGKINRRTFSLSVNVNGKMKL